MPRVLFTADFSYKPKAAVTIAYKASTEKLVRQECADQAIAAGKAREVKPKAKKTDGE